MKRQQAKTFCGNSKCYWRTKCYWRKYNEEQLEWSKDPRSSTIWDQVEEVGYLFRLFPRKTKTTWRFNRNIQDTDWKRTCQLQQILWTSRCHQRTQRTLVKLFKLRCRTIVRQKFFSLRIVNEWNKLPQDVVEAPSTNTFKNRLDRHWHDMGIQSWQLHTSTSTSSNK